MTAVPIPSNAESPLMDETTESDPAGPRPGSPPEARFSDHASSPAAAATPTLRAQVAANPLASFFGAIIVGLLITMITTTNIRINRLEDRVEALDAKFEAKFDQLDAKIEALDAKFDEMNLKLTALIAKLNATDEVDAAIEGRLIDRSSDPVADPAAED